MEEVHQLFNGFKGLDVDRDGFLSVKDVMKYFSKHKASILIDEVKLLFWSLDDNW